MVLENELSFKEDVLISSISLINGYSKSSDLYYKNTRVKDLIIEFSNGEVIKAQLSDDIMDL